MKLNDIATLAKNSRNQQFSLVLKARQLKKIGMTHENILNLKIPKNFKLMKNNSVKIESKGGKKLK